MKKFTFSTLFLAVLFIGLISCNKDDSDNTCNIGKSDTAPIAMDIHFSATQTGDGTIATLTYEVGNTKETVTNPSLPWSIDVQAAAGDAISITASGTADNGSIEVSYDGISGTTEIKGEDYCSHSK
ncbi:hypothetical protein LA303_05835 [Candidatus Sulfidibacterium hydrothermale]|uniref:hypothetical protein n=1 Tax=Candidatus Sulfidibacterium hydrothermale TaxID=2875962 RepID=UPI001F0B3200|nr:hypothetical protein [Candidatus Sulfidibacterium hydrothermale]UBM63487.1 hypothetical protein LA303_05835 [Candidatus Sulfidibacterium hydrothermale]